MNLQAFYSQPFTTGYSQPQFTPTNDGDQVAAYWQFYELQYFTYIAQCAHYMHTIRQQQQHQPQAQIPPVQWPGTLNSFIPATYPSVAAAGAVAAPGAPGETPAAVAAAAGGAADVPNQDQVPAAAAGVAAAGRFPMLVHEPERPERDWLDHVNTICRISFLLLMIYFYSSALRFAIVMCAIAAVFFYRNRRAFFDGTRAPVAVPPPPPPVVQPEQQPLLVAEAGEAQADGGEAAVGGTAAAQNPDNNNNNIDLANRNAAAGDTGNGNTPPTTVLSFLRTFVTSFFYSLLPEQAMAP